MDKITILQAEVLKTLASPRRLEILHAPKEWPQYHPGYYGVFVRDLDGNNVEAVFHGPARRSACSIEISFES